ncbi:MAG: hypothetical protein IH861_14280 [Chloroflexi bacterium]|nr:hypothetical protein [Chloroflexota bacterium]
MRLLTLQVVGFSVKKAPRYSEHTDVLMNVAGVSPDELPRLRKEGVII